MRGLLLLWFCILLVSISVICFLVLRAEFRASINFIINKGGIWLDISLGINRLGMVGIKLRIMQGHRPRVWMRNLITGKYRPFDVLERKYKKIKRKIEIPFRSMMKLGFKVILRKLEAKARIGVEDDAAATALLCGTLLSFFETARTIGTHGRFTPEGSILVKPIFGHDCLILQFKCIIGLKVKDIIYDLVMNTRVKV